MPIRAISSVLIEPQSRLTPEAKLLFNFACAETDAFVEEKKLDTKRGKKLWETLNLAIWMAACEGTLHPLMPNDHAIDESNATLVSWTKYAGKNFLGVVSRFPAGDLLRSGGLQLRDRKKLEALFAGKDEYENENNLKRIADASAKVVKRFGDHLN